MKTTWRTRIRLGAGALFALAATALAAQSTGRLEGRLAKSDGTPLAGVSVAVVSTSLSTLTDSTGSFAFPAVPAGTCSIAFSAGENRATAEGVVVEPNRTARLDRTLDWDLSFAETIVVTSASLRRERITEAPAAMAVISAEEIEREAAHGELPKLLEATPGAELTQSGLYDFNFNTRGFNSSLNRRVATLIDGREPAVPFLGAQEWAGIAFPLDDLAQAELVRGPSAALYGANASSGVLNLITKRPRDSQGLEVKVADGDLSTIDGDVRWAGALGAQTFFKLIGGIRRSDDFAESRNGHAEYATPCPVPQGAATDCLPQEAVALTRTTDEIGFGSVRFDRYWGDGGLSTVEGGDGEIKGPVFQTGIGRVQVDDAKRQWFRFDHTMDHWNFLLAYNARKAPKQTALATGENVALDDRNWKGEIESNWSFFRDRLRLVAGVSNKDEHVDSKDKSGPIRPSFLFRKNQETLLFEPHSASFSAGFAQLDWAATDRLKLVVAGRYDDSDLYKGRFSPKASIVFSPSPNHTFRVSYNEAFQVPNYSEFFLRADVAPPANLAPFEEICFKEGVDCGFDLDNNRATGDTRILAVGNPDLKVETVKTVEVGYTGILGGRAFLSADVYSSRNQNFVTDLLPLLGTALGHLNPQFAPYQTPRCRGTNGVVVPCLSAASDAALLAGLQAALGPEYALLTNDIDGTPILAPVTYTNFGSVDTNGLELGLDWYPTNAWKFGFAYSYFDFKIKSNAPGLGDLLLPNSPKNQANVSAGYAVPRWDAGFSYRWVESFRWVVGPFQGDVPAYGTLDLVANFHFNEHVGVGVNIANALDKKHFESFGGDILRRRALGSLTFRW